MTIPKALTRAEFLRCFAEPMRNVTDTAEATTDIWPYIDQLNPPMEGVANVGEVAHVYRDGSNRYDHVMLETDKPDVFLVVIVDLSAGEVLGHHVLDLKIEYGLRTER